MNKFTLLFLCAMLGACSQKPALHWQRGYDRATEARLSAIDPQEAYPVRERRVYRGTLPCPDCDGIDVRLSLFADQRYIYEMDFPRQSAFEDVKREGSLSYDPALQQIQLDAAADFLLGRLHTEYIEIVAIAGEGVPLELQQHARLLRQH